MAARLNPKHDEATRRWIFYVYELTDSDGLVAYVGKGSGRRLQNQRRNFKLDGREVARFRRERDAYAFERQHIAATSPALNRHPGGNGSRCTPQRKSRYPSDIERIGTQKYAIQLLARFAPHLLRTEHINALR